MICELATQTQIFVQASFDYGDRQPMSHKSGDDPVVNFLPPASAQSWEERIADFLAEVSQLQQDCLTLLRRKQTAIAKLDLAELGAIQTETSEVVRRLEACAHRRTQLLAEAQQVGISAESLRQLLEELPTDQMSPERRRALQLQIEERAWQWRLLNHQALANWLLLQRSLLHLSQVLEIIATGGQPVPTYSMGPAGSGPPENENTGVLVDQRI